MALAALVGLFAAPLAFSSQDAGLKLGTPTLTNNQIQFTLSCESGVAYVIEHSVDLQDWAPVLTNSDSSIARLITADAPSDVDFYRARRSQLPLFGAAMAAVSAINLQGNNIATDSFDSGDTNYSTGGLYPVGSVEKTKAKGDVCTPSILTTCLQIGNANIKGHVKTGPGVGTFSIGPNGTVGSRAWVEGGSTGIQPGWSSTDFNVVFPDVTLPTQIWLPASSTTPGSDTVDGVQYSYIFKTDGDYSINTLSGSVYVSTNAHVRLKISNSYVASSAVIRICPDNGSLQIFMVGTNFSLGGSAQIDNMSGHADRFFLFGLPTCTSILLSGSAAFFGCIYAPQAAFTLGGGGSYTWDFVGSSVTKTVLMNGHFNFHYDENLARTGPFR